MIASLTASGRDIVVISSAQVKNMCANVLEVRSHSEDSKPMVVMSSRALNAFRAEQLDVIRNLSSVLVVDIPTIEEIGGGGARCMLAEVFY